MKALTVTGVSDLILILSWPVRYHMLLSFNHRATEMIYFHTTQTYIFSPHLDSLGSTKKASSGTVALFWPQRIFGFS